ncbi:MAG: hypothetical protein IMZ47_09215, partial [Firmicutes bacterium]|nr:hypothetical protein [Bacillota bacterium]
MPRINRIRIVNFSFNNNNRHILDETFDFYGGENALLSLANGGGKSVLVQVMLQPILPKASLLNRKFGDFFIGKNTPTYIMIEWKLDDGAGYLLTGISIMPRISHSTNEEEQSTDISYFTFFKAYEEGNSFDIKHIPVTEQVGSNLKIASYTEFKKLLQKEADKHYQDMEVFDSSRSKQDDYQKRLGSYGISRDEWKELMVKINEAEHGVSEVFTECKTSKKVMEQWIIKYIEKVLNKSSDSDTSDHKKLETMMSQVAWSLVDNEQHIKEFQAIEGFINDIKEIDNQTKAVLTCFDQEMSLKKEIANGYHILGTENENLKQESIALEDGILQLNKEAERIDIEEKSIEIYKYEERIHEITQELKGFDEKRNNAKDEIETVKYKLNVQKAAERYGIIQEKSQKIADLRERKANAMKNQEKLLKDLNRVKYTLKLLYEEIILKQVANITILKDDETKCKNQIGETKAKFNSLLTEINKLNLDMGGVNKEIETFEKEEPSTLAQLDLQLYRNPLLKEISDRDIQNAANALNQAIDDILKAIQSNNDDIQRLDENIHGLEQVKDNINQRRISVHGDSVLNQEKITGYEKEKDKVITVLKVYNIDEDNIFDQNFVLSKIQEKINIWTTKSYNLKMEVIEIDKWLYSIEQGVSYLPASLVAILKEHNLPCYTGE